MASRSISKKYLFLFLAYGLVGFILPWREFPDMRAMQILLPLVFGIASGINLARMRGGDDIAQRAHST